MSPMAIAGRASSKNKKNKPYSVVSFSEPKKTTIEDTVGWTVTVNFMSESKEDAQEFVADSKMLQNENIASSFRRSEEESLTGQGKPIEELYRKYGI